MDKNLIDRRSFLRIAGKSVGVGVLYQFAPILGRRAEAGPITDFFRRVNGEAPASFCFAQFSDTHVGFQGPPDPLGTKAFETAVDLINRGPQHPDFVLFTGDLTHDAPSRDLHAQRMQQFKSIAARLKTAALYMVPGENDAGTDVGALYHEHFGASHYSFDYRGVHFVALDNVLRGRPEVGSEQIAWLKADLARFPKTAPIVVFTHRPLFDLKPEWEWFTSDGDQVMNALAPFENVTVLYGHIHRRHVFQDGRVPHYAARSLIFAFDDPATNQDKKPLPFDPKEPFANLGIRIAGSPASSGNASFEIKDTVLTRNEYSGTSGIQQMMKPNRELNGGASNDAD